VRAGHHDASFQRVRTLKDLQRELIQAGDKAIETEVHGGADGSTADRHAAHSPVCPISMTRPRMTNGLMVRAASSTHLSTCMRIFRARSRWAVFEAGDVAASVPSATESAATDHHRPVAR